MKVHFYVNERDLEYLDKILKDYNNMDESIHILNIPSKDTIQVSLGFEEFIKLRDLGVFVNLISL